MKQLLLITVLFLGFFSTSISQKSLPTSPQKSSPTRIASPTCPLSVSIQDNIPTAVCSELLKTLVAVTPACTDTTAVSYSWSSTAGGVFSTSRTTTFNLPEYLVATPVTFTVTVVEGTETVSANYTITVNPRPSRPSLTPFGTIVLCDNNFVTLTSSACTGGSTTIWSNGASGVSSISVPPTGGTYYSVACYKNGCISDSTAAAALITGLVTSPPTTTSRVICEGTAITTGNGLQADLVNCNNGASGTYTYAGGTVGYDAGRRSTGSVDPSINIPTLNSIIKKVSVSITWRKQKGGYENSCGVGDTETWPYHNETQFRVKSPSGKIVTLVNTNTYGGSNNPTITTVFEDGGTPINFYSPPVSGTFAPAQPLSGFIGENPTGIWTLLPYDAVGKDPLCVSGFSVTFSEAQNGTITWWDAPTGGNQVGTGSEFIPTNTSAGTYTFYAQGQCVRGCPSIRTAASLTIRPTPSAPLISVNVPDVNGTKSICFGDPITLTATACTGTVKWNSNQNGTNFATGATYTFTPSGSNFSNTTHSFTAICEASNLCKSVNSNSLSVVVKYKPAQPTISGPGASICSNTNITLTASACSGGTLGWTGNRFGSSINFVLTSAVNIKVACTVNGCTSDSSNVYSMTPLPRPNPLTVNASQVQALCYGADVTLSASACAGTVKWTGNLSGSPITVTPLTSRSYKASCLGTNGCASDSSTALTIIVLPKIKPTITGSTFICGTGAGIPVTLTATGCSGVGETVMWRNESTGLTYTETISQTKTFRAVCIRGGYCVSDSSDIFTVQYRNKPTQPTITPPQNTTICQGSSVSLTASACVGGTLGWTGGLSGQSVSVSPNVTKSYKVACLVNGCLSDSSSAVTITVNIKPAQPTINQINPTICLGQITVLSVSAIGGINYAWTGGLIGTSISISPIITKIYKVAATVNSCISDSASVSVNVNILPTAPSISLGGEVCTNTLPNKVWDNLISTPSGCTVKSLINNSDGGTFTVIQEPSLVKIAKLNSSGTVLWSRYLNTSPLSGTPNINSAIQTSDGGYLLGGSIISLLTFGDANFLSKVNSISGASTSDFWILKVDANGTTQWSKNYGGDNKDELSKIEKTSDGGYLLGGLTNSAQGYDVSQSGGFNDDFWIVKIDGNGNKIWDKRHRPANSLGDVLSLKSVKESSDGGFLLSSYSYINSTGQGHSIKFYVYKINSSGVKLWENAYENISLKNCFLRAVEKTNDNGYLLVGEDAQNSSFNSDDILLIKINSNGVKQWSKIFATPSSDGAFVIKAIPNENNFLIGGYSDGNGGDRTELSKGSNDIWLIKINSDGTKIWDKSLGGSGLDYAHGLDFDNDSKIILGGFSSSPATGDKTINGPGAWFVKIASSCPANVSSTICKGDSVSLKANGCVGIVNWSNGAIGSTFNAKPIITTNYTATCTNGNGCISPLSTAFTVTVSTPPTPTITPPTNSTICQGSSITLSATGCTGGTYAWTGGLTGTSISVSPSSTRAYKVACTLNTCTSDSSSAVTITVNPKPAQPTINQLNPSICTGQSTTLSVTSVNGATYSWTGGLTGTSILVSPIITRTYKVIATIIGCVSDSADVEVTTIITPSISSNTLDLCNNSPITLSLNNVEENSFIQWRKNGEDIPYAINNNLDVTTQGVYNVSNLKLVNNYVESPIEYALGKAFFINPSVGWIGGNNKIIKTVDGGNIWNMVYTNTGNNNFIGNIQFINPSVGWASGIDSGNNNRSIILKTIDGGQTWVEYTQPVVPNDILGMKFRDVNNGLIVGYNIENPNRVHYTNNGGDTWNLSTLNINFSYEGFVDIAFIPNSSNCWIIGNAGSVYKSTNNGVAWTLNYDFQGALLHSIYFLNSQEGWITGGDGFLAKTINGGSTWNIIANSTLSDQFITSVHFTNSLMGWIGVLNNGSSGEPNLPKLMKTIDGGDTWFSVFSGDNNFGIGITSMQFLDNENVWLQFSNIVKKMVFNQCPIAPVTVINSCCSTFETIKSGSWIDPTTWSCNRVPVATDDVIINTGHTITNTVGTIRAKSLNYRGGNLQISSTSNLILGN